MILGVPASLRQASVPLHGPCPRMPGGERVDPLGLGLGLVVAAVAAAAGYVAGRGIARSGPNAGADTLRRLEEYDFYPFVVTDEGLVEFSPDSFDRAV